MALAALSGAAALALAACGGSSNGSNSSGSGASGPASFNAAITKVVNPSTHKGGTLSFGLSSTPDSTDPGNTYYAFMWNFARLYTMPLMTYKSCPGQCGLQVVPDLATGPGVVSDNGLTWTYHIQPDVKFEDGTTVTSRTSSTRSSAPSIAACSRWGPTTSPGCWAGTRRSTRGRTRTSRPRTRWA